MTAAFTTAYDLLLAQAVRAEVSCERARAMFDQVLELLRRGVDALQQR